MSSTWRGLLAFAAASGILAGCKPAPAERPAPPPPIVTVAKPISTPYSDYRDFTGRLEPVDRVDLRARVGGFLKEVHFNDGDLVEEGQLLFTLDPSTFEAVVKLREATLERARATAALAKVTMERNETLVGSGAVSRQEFDVAAAQFAEASAAVTGTEAELEAARLDLSFAEIRAPFAGRISRSEVSVGSLVVANNTLLARMNSTSPLHAYFDLDEAMLLDYQRTRPALEGDDKTLRARQIPVSMALGDSGDFAFPGMLDYSDPSVNPETGTLRVRGVFDNPEMRLLPGLFVRLRVTGDTTDGVVRIPQRAVGTDQARRFAYVIDGDGAVQYRELKLGREGGGLVIVEEGLSAEDTVVIDGLLRIRPGVKPDAQPADLSAYTGEAGQAGA
jgi:multidrug efflux system membrane fusion protein